MAKKNKVIKITAEVGNPMFIVSRVGTIFKTDQVRYLNGDAALLASIDDDPDAFYGKVVTRISKYPIDNIPDHVCIYSDNVFGNICDSELSSSVLVIETVEPHLLAETDNILSLLDDANFDAKVWVSEEIH